MLMMLAFWSNFYSVQLASSDHDQLEEDEDGCEDLGVLVAGQGGELLAEQVLEAEQHEQEEQAPQSAQEGRLVRSLKIEIDTVSGFPVSNSIFEIRFIFCFSSSFLPPSTCE